MRPPLFILTVLLNYGLPQCFSYCIYSSDISIVLDVDRWYLFQQEFLPALASILKRVQQKNCHNLTIHNLREYQTIKIKEEVTHDFLFNRLATYQTPTKDHVDGFYFHDRINTTAS